jgi:hypothetical protein
MTPFRPRGHVLSVARTAAPRCAVCSICGHESSGHLAGTPASLDPALSGAYALDLVGVISSPGVRLFASLG